MDTRHRSPAGALVAQCSDEDACMVFSCAVCLAEVPADSIKVTDAQDYVQYFCGLDCLEAWRKQVGIRHAASPARRSDQLK